MKKKCLLLLIVLLSLILILTLLPISFISANPGNLAKNSSFSDGLNHWGYTTGVSIVNGTVFVDGVSGWYGILQDIDTSNKNLTFSFDYKPYYFNGSGQIMIGFNIPSGSAMDFGTDTLGEWDHASIKISELWADSNGGANLPDFNMIQIWVGVNNDAEAYFDNVKLTATEKEAVEEGFIRTMPMTCYQVWVNADNKFEFVFWYPYADNNWVKIYDMSGKEVYSVDMPLDDPHIIVDLPNGMYTVKTFNDDPATPLQTFVIGK